MNHNLKLYRENPSIFQKYIALTNQKQLLIDKVYNKIIDNYKAEKITLLDIGCADGMVTVQIMDKLRKSYQLKVNVIEASEKLINSFKLRTGYDINFINENVESLNELPKSDFILIAHVVPYIDNLEKFLNKVINSLDNNGIALIVVSNNNSDDRKIKRSLNKQKIKETISDNVKKVLSEKKVKYDVEIVDSEIDVSGIENMNENGKIIIEFFKHKRFEDISLGEINDIRNIILKMANENKKIIKREDYIWIFNN
jgi:2-polyprenyl-3-methyl-5-hydroxy-6-metoxy-1,4-benzoquinol methylase